MSPTGSRKRPDPNGFTFFELLLVLLILGLFSSYAVPRLERSFAGGDLQLASRSLAGEISELRGKAAHSRMEQVLSVNLESNVFYPVERQDEPSGDRIEKKSLPPGVGFEDLVLPSRGRVRGGEADIRFFANGCVEPAFIHLRNEGGGFYTLELNPVTGLVRVQDGYVEPRRT